MAPWAKLIPSLEGLKAGSSGGNGAWGLVMAQWSSGGGLQTDFQNWELQVEGLDPFPNYKSLPRLAGRREGWGAPGTSVKGSGRHSTAVLSTGRGGKGWQLPLGGEQSRGQHSSTSRTPPQVEPKVSPTAQPHSAHRRQRKSTHTTYSHMNSDKPIHTQVRAHRPLSPVPNSTKA